VWKQCGVASVFVAKKTTTRGVSGRSVSKTSLAAEVFSTAAVVTARSSGCLKLRCQFVRTFFSSAVTVNVFETLQAHVALLVGSR